jgi:hypothetical protein
MSDDFYSTARLEEDLDAAIDERKTQERIATLEKELRDVTAERDAWRTRFCVLHSDTQNYLVGNVSEERFRTLMNDPDDIAACQQYWEEHDAALAPTPPTAPERGED